MDDAPVERGGTLNVALADQWRLLDLAELDARLDRLKHRRSTLPEAAALADLTGRQKHVADLLVAARTEASDIAREQTKAEADVDAVRQRAARDQQRLDSGAVSSPKELENLQHEITSLAKRQGDLEEVVLEVMERAESVAARVEELTGEADGLAAEIGTTTAARDAAYQEIDTESRVADNARSSLAGGLPADFIALYEKIRASAGTGAAALKRGRCEGCRVELSVTDLAAVKAAADDAVVRCEECRRILVRTADSGL